MNTIHSEKTSGDVKKSKDIDGVLMAMISIHSEKNSGDIKKSKDIDGVLMRP